MRAAVFFVYQKGGFQANLCRHQLGPVGFQRSSRVARFSVQLYPSTVEIFNCLQLVFIFIAYPKEGSQNIDGRQLSLSCPPVLHADGGAAQAELPLDQHVHCS